MWYSLSPILNISIHASHAGCDCAICLLCASRVIFQSTHPMRDATSRWQIGYKGLEFQSTHPMRDATLTGHISNVATKFQSTHPMRDATAIYMAKQSPSEISIHASHAGCDGKISDGIEALPISIHASHAGCDWESLTDLQDHGEFQSTHPMRDATTSTDGR